MILAFLLIATAQTTSPDWCRDEPHPIAEFKFDEGPFEFTQIDGLKCLSAFAGLVGGQDRYRIELSMRSAHVKLLNYARKQAVLEGLGRNVSIVAELGEDPGHQASYFSVDSQRFSFSLTSTAPVKYRAGSGWITIPTGAHIDVSSAARILVEGTASQKYQGSMGLVVQTPLTWQGMRLTLKGIPRTFIFAFTSLAGSESEWVYDLPASRLRLRQGDFRLTRAQSLSTKEPVYVSTAQYEARVIGAVLKTMSARVEGNQIQLSGGPFQVVGDLVAKNGDRPAGLSANARVTSIDARAFLDSGIVILEDVTLSHVKLTPNQWSYKQVSSRAAKGQVSVPAPWEPNSWADSALTKLGVTSIAAQRDSAISEAQAALDTLKSPNTVINVPTWLVTAVIRKHISSYLAQLDTLVASPQLLTGVISVQSTLTPVPAQVRVIVRALPSPIAEGLSVRYSVILPSVGESDIPGKISLSKVAENVLDADTAASRLVDGDTATVALPNFDFSIPADTSVLAGHEGVGGQIEFRAAKAKLTVTGAVPLIDYHGVHVLFTQISDWNP